MARFWSDEDGLGITEAIVAMVLFGLVAVAMVPVFILGIKVSANTTQIATAAQVANDRVERARAANADCLSFVTFLTEAIPTYEDARGVPFEVTQVPSAANAAAALVDAGAEGDSNGDGVLDSFCAMPSDDNAWARQVMEISVDVKALNQEKPDVAAVATKVAVPGFNK